MSGNRIFIDTNIIIYHLNGDSTLESLLQGKEVFVSFISKIEFKSQKTFTKEAASIIDRFLSFTHIVHSNDSICEEAGRLRRVTNIKTPDAIIAATSKFLKIPLVTSDHVFHKIHDLEVIEYQPNLK
jgi:predicted nucleic acid-binding protein